MAEHYKKGDKLEWNWGGGVGRGEVVTAHTEKTTKTIKGAEVTRDADQECPAYTIRQDDGDLVLKSHSEVRKSS